MKHGAMRSRYGKRTVKLTAQRMKKEIVDAKANEKVAETSAAERQVGRRRV